jgi:hypothetical protein
MSCIYVRVGLTSLCITSAKPSSMSIHLFSHMYAPTKNYEWNVGGNCRYIANTGQDFCLYRIAAISNPF